MKLYTEEQIKNMLTDTWSYSETEIDSLINSLTPILLPSDEQIMKEASKTGILASYKAFLVGAKWMRDKIQGGNK